MEPEETKRQISARPVARVFADPFCLAEATTAAAKVAVGRAARDAQPRGPRERGGLCVLSGAVTNDDCGPTARVRAVPSAVTRSDDATAVDAASLKSPAPAPRPNQRSLVVSVYDSERAYFDVRADDPARARHVRSLAACLAASGVFDDPAFVLARHALEKSALSARRTMRARIEGEDRTSSPRRS